MKTKIGETYMISIGSLIFTFIILTIISIYPFYVRKYKPYRYTGIWKTFGDINKTAYRALIYPIVYLGCGLLDLIFVQ